MRSAGCRRMGCLLAMRRVARRHAKRRGSRRLGGTAGHPRRRRIVVECIAVRCRGSGGGANHSFITRGPIPPLILAPCVFFFVFLLWRFEASSDWQSGRDDMAGPGDRSSCNPRATRSQVSKAIVTRAWQAAVLGLFCFQPLGFYSMRLLWKLSGRDTQLGRADASRAARLSFSICFPFWSVAGSSLRRCYRVFLVGDQLPGRSAKSFVSDTLCVKTPQSCPRRP